MPAFSSVGGPVRIADEFHQVARIAIEHLDHANCESSCYIRLREAPSHGHTSNVSRAGVIIVEGGALAADERDGLT